VEQTLSNKYDIKLLEATFSPWRPGKEADKQIAVLMSGGVDSTVAAYLLNKQGWDVLGITMKIPLTCNSGKRGCCGADAALVCNELGIAHYFVDVTGPFEEIIIKSFRLSYHNGRTPNPCVDCNTFLKFSLLWDFLKQEFGISYLATGHYATILKANGNTYLAGARDNTKDQSYFLYGIRLERLSRLVLPLGRLTKSEVRSIAAGLNLSVAEKPESMELCFAAEGDYRAALDHALRNRPGDLTDMQGNKIGTHAGIANFTLGQRRGIGYAGGKPLYVGRINAAANTVALGTREEIARNIVAANHVNVLAPEDFFTGNRLFGKIRSYGDPQPCTLLETVKTTMTVRFDRPQFAPCPGQRLVLYAANGTVVAGGTIMTETIPWCNSAAGPGRQPDGRLHR